MQCVSTAGRCIFAKALATPPLNSQEHPLVPEIRPFNGYLTLYEMPVFPYDNDMECRDMTNTMENTDRPIVDMPTLRRDLYLLTSLLLADKTVGKMPDVVAWTGVFHESEVARLVLWTSAALRSLLDLPEEKNNLGEQHCGEYWNDFPSHGETALTFRQACNSAIHAKEIMPYWAPEHEPKRMDKPFYIDRITVRGSHKGKATRAQIDIIRFVQIANDLIHLSFKGDDHGNR